MVYRPRLIASSLAASVVMLAASLACLPLGDTRIGALVVTGVMFGFIPIVMAVAFDGYVTFAPPPPELPSFLAALRRTLSARGYTREACDGSRYTFREPRFLGSESLSSSTSMLCVSQARAETSKRCSAPSTAGSSRNVRSAARKTPG